MPFEPFIGQIIPVPYNFAPRGWAFCNGQILSITQNTALFSLLGTFYGGDGRTNFALPNLQGSVAIGSGQGAGLSNYDIGEVGGAATVTLLASQNGTHTHNAMAFGLLAGNTASPSAASWANPASDKIYSSTGGSHMSPAAVTAAGTGQPHNNLQPYLVLNYIIALQGIFPARN